MAAKPTRAEKVEQALDTLRGGITELINSEGWVNYLTAQSKFHRYSGNNTMLIWIQRPDATHVAGYKAWQKLGRQVRKGEKGIVILAPCIGKVEDEETGEKVRRLFGFTTTHVFDIAQTDGEPLPENPTTVLTDGDGDEALRLALIEQITAAGFTYIDEGVYGSANGFTDFAGRRVVVDENLPPAQRVKTTAHELAHVMLHDPSDKDATTERGLAEVEAESVAYIVLHALGYDAGDYSFGYIAGWSGSDPEKVEAVAKRVSVAAKQILDTIADSKKEVTHAAA